jgi:hypothetical protein
MTDMAMARNDGHCASLTVCKRTGRSSAFPFIIKASGISNIRVGVVYKAKHEVCTQVVAFSLPGSGCS